jgi:hypothetical protein
MQDRSSQPQTVRRTPSLGVSGVTLLMLVTLVLTTSPALGRSRDLGAIDSTRTQVGSERALPTERAEKRVGGQREVPNRHIRPVGSGLILSLARRVPSPLAAIVPVNSHQPPIGCIPADRIAVALLNLPPPAC